MTCRTCRFFYEEKANEISECRRRSPTVECSLEDSDLLYSVWPDVEPDDWCGEYQPTDDAARVAPTKMPSHGVGLDGRRDEEQSEKFIFMRECIGCAESMMRSWAKHKAEAGDIYLLLSDRRVPGWPRWSLSIGRGGASHAGPRAQEHPGRGREEASRAEPRDQIAMSLPENRRGARE